MLGAVARRSDDFAAAEDAVQEALIAAASRWPAEGVPRNPRGWLYHVALRRLTDQVRSEMARRRREDAIASEVWAEWAFVPPPDADPGADQDDTLTLLFMCCHPALTPPSAIALTLRAVGGLTTAEIARAFLVPEPTMAQRISRAKQSIKTSDVPFSLPNAGERESRLAQVLQVLYLVFNEGYTTSAGPDLHRVDLSGEAIRLGRLLRALLPADREVAGLLALMLLTDARRRARTGPMGELIPLDEPPSAEQTDWPQILALYDVLKGVSDNPMVALNHAVAAAMVHGPAAGLELLDGLDRDRRLAGHYRLDAVRGHLLERAGNRAGALAHYRAAAEGTASLPERNYLLTKAARLAANKDT